jgi:ribonuclease HI/pterin-4a-carbinolamine dehydratase
MWQETKRGLFKQFNFINFQEALNFIIEVARIAEKNKHYPRIENEWNVVNIWIFTSGDNIVITETDKAMAKEINSIAGTGKPESNIEHSKNLQHDFIKIYADGGSRGNPGPSASGFVLMDSENKILLDKGVYLGITTNNQAEYTALKLALEAARELRAKDIDVYMDSLLVINQMRGIFKVRNRDLWPIHSAIVGLVKEFGKVNFTHVPRELNKLADAAVNRALDETLRIKD